MAPQDQTTLRAPGRGTRIALAISLALNLVVAGAIGGTLLADRGRSPNPTVRDIGFGAFTAALSPEDRAALGRAFRERSPDLRSMRRDMRDEMADLVLALRARPFDERAVQSAIAAQNEHGRARMELGQRLLAERLISMSPSEREAFAARLEQAMQRGRDRPPGRSGPGD